MNAKRGVLALIAMTETLPTNEHIERYTIGFFVPYFGTTRYIMYVEKAATKVMYIKKAAYGSTWPDDRAVSRTDPVVRRK